MQTMRPGEWVDTGKGLSDFTFTEYEMQISTDRYTSREYADRERDAIWMRVWQVVGREDELPEVGDWKTHQLYDQSYIIVRGEDGVIRGFVNACRHRGNLICKDACGNAKKLLCNYHLWSFELDGRLRKVYRPELVGPIDVDAHGLLPVKVECFAGFIFFNPDPDAAPLSEFLGEAKALLEPYRMHEMTTVLNVREAIDCNWKVVVDAFTEGYHISGIHPELLRIIDIDPTKNRFNYFGDHAVACAPFEVANKPGFGPEQQIEGIRELPGTFPGVAEILPRFEELVDIHRDAAGALALPDGVTPRTILQQATREVLTAKGVDVSGLTDAQMTDNHGWLLFPNFFMTVRAGEATVIIATPHPDGDPNKCIWHITSYFWLQPEYREAFQAALIDVKEPGEFVYFLALKQDYDQMPRQQAGLRNTRLEFMSLAREEIGIARFHSVVDRYMAEQAGR
jgi:nitrite reductase/ring-hydroxylating ferredoxin subunit